MKSLIKLLSATLSVAFVISSCSEGDNYNFPIKSTTKAVSETSYFIRTASAINLLLAVVEGRNIFKTASLPDRIYKV